MNIIGGVIYHDPVRAADPSVLGTLLPGAHGSEQARRTDAAGGVLAGVGAGVVFDHPGDGALVADLDLTNLDELPGISDGISPARSLEQLHARYGTDFVTRLRGAFAVAIWIPSRRRLVLVSDRLGFRRLYYAVSGAGVAF